MAKKIWAASGGSYSDYRVYSLYEREEDAEAYVKSSGDSLWLPPSKAHGEISAMPEYVEEFPFHAAGEVPEIFVWFKAVYSPVQGEVVADEYRVEGKAPPPRPLVFMQKEPPFGPVGKAGYRETPVAWGADRNSVLKTVKDRFAALKFERGLQ